MLEKRAQNLRLKYYLGKKFIAKWINDHFIDKIIQLTYQ